MKRTQLTAIIFFIAIIAGVCVSCKDDTVDSGPIDIVFPDSNVSYGRYVQPLFDRGCAFRGCHGEDTFDARGFSLDSYQHARAKTGIIVQCFPSQPCDPEESILVRRIEGLDGLARMPYNRTPLTTNQINGIKQWIREYAQNN